MGQPPSLVAASQGLMRWAEDQWVSGSHLVWGRGLDLGLVLGPDLGLTLGLPEALVLGPRSGPRGGGRPGAWGLS